MIFVEIKKSEIKLDILLLRVGRGSLNSLSEKFSSSHFLLHNISSVYLSSFLSKKLHCLEYKGASKKLTKGDKGAEQKKAKKIKGGKRAKQPIAMEA